MVIEVRIGWGGVGAGNVLTICQSGQGVLIQVYTYKKKNQVVHKNSPNLIKRMRRQATDWEKIFAKTYLIIRGLLPKI